MSFLSDIVNGAAPMDNNYCEVCGAICSNDLVNCPSCGAYIEISIEVKDMNTKEITYIR
jgi:rubrerythrin